MQRILFLLFIALLLIANPAAATAQPLSCRAPQKPMLEVTMFFGRGSTIRFGVSETRWSQFLATEITPRFADGLTVLDATGQWRPPQTTRILRERSKVVVIVAADEPQIHERVAAIAAAYKQRFRQQSVGIATHSVCASF